MDVVQDAVSETMWATNDITHENFWLFGKDNGGLDEIVVKNIQSPQASSLSAEMSLRDAATDGLLAQRSPQSSPSSSAFSAAAPVSSTSVAARGRKRGRDDSGDHKDDGDNKNDGDAADIRAPRRLAHRIAFETKGHQRFYPKVRWYAGTKGTQVRPWHPSPWSCWMCPLSGRRKSASI